MQLLGHDLELSISLGQETCHKAEQFFKAGFTATEFDLPVHYHEPINLSEIDDFLKAQYQPLKDSGLKITSWHIPFGRYWDISSPDEGIRQGALKAHKELLNTLEPLDGVNLVIHPSFEPIKEEDRDKHILACQKSLAELAPIARDKGKRLALENLPRTCLGRTSVEMALLTMNGEICDVCMDTTHLFHETQENFLDVCGKWVVNTHLSDYLTGQNECHWVPGTGSLNWRAIFERLIALPYTGTYNFEVFHAAPLELLGGLKNALDRRD